MTTLSLCRTCTKLINNDKLIKLFDNTHNWITKIEEITGILLKNSKELPQFICKLCQDDLKIAYEFKERCINAQKYFNSVDFVCSENLIENVAIKNESLGEISNCNEYTSVAVEIKDEIPIEEKYLNEYCFVKTEKNDVLQNKAECLGNDSGNNGNGYNSEEFSDVLCLNKPNKVLPFGAKKKYRKRVQSKRESKKREVKSQKASSRRLKTEGDSNSFVCDQCGIYFNCKSKFLTHQRRHTGEKEYHCEICPEQFFLHSELKRHVRKHTGERPYPCRYCERRFMDYSTRFRHERSHKNERPFACTQCLKAFTNSYILKNHMLSHTGERSFRCNMCAKSFGRKCHLVTHYRSMQHKQNLEKHQQNITSSPSQNAKTTQSTE